MLLGSSLTACGNNGSTTDKTLASPPAISAPATGPSSITPAPRPDFGALLRELKRRYPKAGWTLALATQTADSICNDLGTYTFDEVVKDRTGVLGDKAQTQEIVIASVVHVCPALKGEVPGLS
ncbi:hypothetical protein GCM10028801_10770 [Nocardioides maradonensis]